MIFQSGREAVILDPLSADQLLANEGRPSSKNSEDWEGQMCKVSISHDGDYATATAIVCNDAPTGE
jgi:phosphopantetheinyl transferase (holo-ACP synthase)